MSFWSELKRRNVFKVGIAYVIVAWVILQVASITFPALHLPGWALTLVTVILIIGFFLAVIFAWAFELTADGVKRTSEVPHDESITHVTGRKINYILGGLLVIAVALLIFDNYYLDRRVVEQEVVSTDAEQSPGAVEKEEVAKTIAVLPFADMSPEKDQEYFVDGLSEELLNCLAKIQDLQVIARTSSFAFKGTDKTIKEIADVLGANHILEGSVRKAGNSLRITAQLIRAADGIHLWSEAYDRELDDIFTIQEDIATAVANELKVTLGIGSSLKQLGGTDNINAYNLYLDALGQFSNWDSEGGLTSINSAIELDPKFALAWTLKARVHMRNIGFGSANRSTEERYAALIAVQQALALEPNLVEANLVFATFKLQSGNLVDAELAFRKYLDKTNNLLWSDLLVHPILHYMAVGQLKKAQEISELRLLNDPLNSGVRIFYIHNFCQLGNQQRAEEENKRAGALIGDQWKDLTVQIRQEMGDVFPSDSEANAEVFYDAIKEYLDSPKDALAKLHQIHHDNKNLSQGELTSVSRWAAYFGDPDFALEAMKKAQSIDFFGTYNIWFPVMREVRQLPQFKKLVREIGLVDYWEQFGWPDLCRPTDDGDFVCD